MSEVVVNENELFTIVEGYVTDPNELKLISKSYATAERMHEGKSRLNGELNIAHCTNVALTVALLEMDAATISAALLHDILDHGYTKEMLEKEFPKDVVNIIVDVYKVNNIPVTMNSSNELKNLMKAVVAVVDDVRVIIIKLADRLDGMRTLYAISEKSRKEKSVETLNIYAPLAHRLGLNAIKSELEDLSLRYYKPSVYFDISKMLNKTRLERDNAVVEMIDNVSNILDDNGIEHIIKGRAKSIYSIYNKMESGKRFEDLYDLFALRVIVDTKDDCYHALSLIHAKYKPVDGRYKDYIANPKKNMYQSLHTTVHGDKDHIFEVQIRTKEMDLVAEAGIAAHFAYKDKSLKDSKKVVNFTENKLKLFKDMIDIAEDINTVNLENDKHIYVFTKDGKPIELPIGSTPIDFAYAIHTEIGNKTVGAIVNDQIQPLDYKLENGDVIKINTNNNAKPNKNWLNFAYTNSAKSKIKAYFNKLDKTEAIKNGEQQLLKELRKKKIDFNSMLTGESLNDILKEFGQKSIDELYLAIDSNKITIRSLINYHQGINVNKEDEIINKLLDSKVTSVKSKNDIIISGMDNLKYNIAECCKAVPGDEIIGYVTKNSSISIHRICCHNALDNERSVSADWNNNGKLYPATFYIECLKQDNILLKITNKLSLSSCLFGSVKTFNKSDSTIFELTVMCKNVDDLSKCSLHIKSIPEVISIERYIK